MNGRGGKTRVLNWIHFAKMNNKFLRYFNFQINMIKFVVISFTKSPISEKLVLDSDDVNFYKLTL